MNPSPPPKLFGLCAELALGITLGVALAIPAGCSSRPGRASADSARFGPVLSPGLTRIIYGKPRDLAPALSRSATAIGLALVERRELPAETPGVLFTLVGRVGEPASVRIDYPEKGAADLEWLRSPKDMRLTLRIGRFGEGARERALADQFERELDDLAPEP